MCLFFVILSFSLVVLYFVYTMFWRAKYFKDVLCKDEDESEKSFGRSVDAISFILLIGAIVCGYIGSILCDS